MGRLRQSGAIESSDVSPLWIKQTTGDDGRITALSRLGEDDQQPVAPYARVTDGGLDSDGTAPQSTSKISESGNQETTRLRFRAGQTTPHATEALD